MDSYIWNNLSGPIGIAGAITSLILFYFLFIYENRVDKMMKKFPGPMALPILGNALSFYYPETIVEKFSNWRNKYGNRFRVKIGFFSHVFITAPADIEKVLTSNVLLEKGDLYFAILPWLSNGLLIQKDEKWQARRKLLNPAFHIQVQDSFLPTFNEHASTLIGILKEKGANGQLVEIESPLTRLAVDIVCETIFGTKCNIQKTKNDSYWKASIRQTQLIYERWGRPWLNWESTWKLTGFGREDTANLKILHGFRDRLIRERKEQFLIERQTSTGKFAPSPNDSTDGTPTKNKFALLDMLLNIQANGGSNVVTDDDLKKEVDTILFEGHDNTAVVLTFTTYLLALHPEYQAELHAELDSIFGDDHDRPVTADDLSKMKYLSYCINESLRVFPSVPAISRKVKEDFYLDDTTIVPKGANITIAIAWLHRNPELYEDPEEFRPSRFFPENAAGRHAYAYVPFSGGPRNCIGQRYGYIQLKLVLAHLFRNFRVETIDSKKTVKLMPQVISRFKDEVRVRLFPRQ